MQPPISQIKLSTAKVIGTSMTSFMECSHLPLNWSLFLLLFRFQECLFGFYFRGSDKVRLVTILNPDVNVDRNMSVHVTSQV